MKLERRQVLLSRWPFWRQWRDKEWWYSGVWDAHQNIYFSWYFVRVNLIDEVVATLFAPELGAPVRVSKKLYLESPGRTDLSLEARAKGFTVSHLGSAEEGWSFALEAPGLTADLRLSPQTPVFSKFDDPFTDRYGLIHFFHNRVTGTIKTGSRTFTLDKALGYGDHAFGTVPSRSGWHWLAVQNPDLAFTSLVNYGVNPQRYTQSFQRNEGGWIRSDQNVSFEQDPTEPDASWRVTSSDVDLRVTTLQSYSTTEHIPPLLPFLINLTHEERYVKAEGRIRVEGRWQDVGSLGGVMEIHHGRW